jgi:hypothetical protein
MNNRSRILPLVATAFLAFAAEAQVYKYTDKDGKVQYTDKPPSDAKSAEIRVDKPSEGARTGTDDWREKERALNTRLGEKRRDQDRCIRAKEFLKEFAKHLETNPRERIYINGRRVTPDMVDDARRAVRDYCAPG